MNETALYNSAGAPQAYVDHSDGTIFAWNGKPLAYLYGERIVGFNGKHLGWFEDGIIRDQRGMQAGFVQDKCRVLTQLQPLKGLKQLKPLKSLVQLAPLRPLNSLSTTTGLLDILNAGRS